MTVTRYRWLAILLIGGSCAAGYAVGKATWNPTISQQESAAISSTRPVRNSDREKRINQNLWEQLTALLNPNSREVDIWNIISRLPADRIPDALRDLRAAQFNAPTGSAEAKRLDEIESALYFHWAESDPQAALADVSTMPGEPYQQYRRTALVKSVLASWMQADPDAAFRAVKNHKDFADMGRAMWVATWTPVNVFQNAALLPDMHRELLIRYCLSAAKDDTKRNAMLTALKQQPEMRDRDSVCFMLFRTWASRDFPAAIAEVEQHNQPGLMESVMEVGLGQQPASALGWAVSHDIPQSPVWVQSYKKWLRSDADDAQRWFAEQSREWISAGQSAIVAGFLSAELESNDSIKGKVDTQATGEKLLALVEDWQAKDPQAAGKWLKTASESVRKLINGKGSDDHE